MDQPVQQKKSPVKWIVLGVVVVAVLALLGGIWGFYNSVVEKQEVVDNAWAKIQVQYQRRLDLIPNLVETVKGYAAHEKEALQAVTDARSRYFYAADTDGQMKASTELSGAVGRLMAVAESYPELKANQNFLHLQQQLSSMEEKLANYRQFYNDTVLRYDRLLETIPTNLIAKMFHFKKEEFFKVEKSEKAKVTIRF